MFLTNLDTILRGYKAPDGYRLKVWEEPGWKARTYAAGGMLGVAGVLWHHTATRGNGTNYPSRTVLRDGHAGLAGPLCNLSLMKDGTVGIVAAGQANHAGRGSIGGAYENMGNYWLIGIEAESDGVTNDWTPEQIKAMPHIGAALDLGFSGGKDFYQIAHREYSYDGKIDPSFVDMDALRANINKLLTGGTITTGGTTGPGLSAPFPAGTRISQNFGAGGVAANRSVGGHTGTDYAVPIGTHVRAIGAGTVVWAGPGSSLPGDDTIAGWNSRWWLTKNFPGNIVGIRHHDGFISFYAHLSSWTVTAGQSVTRGQIIGKSGATGEGVTGPHTHVEVLNDLTYSGGNWPYGRTDAVAFINNHQAPSGAVSQKDEFDMASIRDLEIAVNKIFQQSKGLIRECVHDVLHQETVKREGSVNGKPVGGTTTVIKEIQYIAKNFGDVRADIVFAQNQIVKLPDAVAAAVAAGGAVTVEGQPVNQAAIAATVRDVLNSTELTVKEA